MSREKYRPWSPDPTCHLPPSAKDLLLENHCASSVPDPLNELDMTPVVGAILCQESGIVELGPVAIDGSEVKADASTHEARSDERLTRSERKLLAEVDELRDRSAREDADEDGRFGVGRRKIELPDELKGKQNWLATLEAARARLEQLTMESRAATLSANVAGLRERAEHAAPGAARARGARGSWGGEARTHARRQRRGGRRRARPTAR